MARKKQARSTAHSVHCWATLRSEMFRHKFGENLTFVITFSLSKTLFVIPTDAHYYKNHRMLKQFKIITLAPTCFGSHRSHHQGAVLCLAKTTEWFFRARRYRRSQRYGGISACCAGMQFT